MEPESRAADLARYYDLDLLSDPGDRDFYLDLAAAGAGPILELAAGSGRLAVPLAASGHDMTGVDNDPAMLDRARIAWAGAEPPGRGGRGRGAGSLTLVEHDLTTLDLPERFNLVILALNSLLLLDGRAAQGRALNKMRAHLAPGGRAVVDIWLPTPQDLELYDGRQVLDWIRTDPGTGERVAKTTVARYDAATQRATLTTTFDAAHPDAQPADAPPRSTTREDAVTFINAGELLELAGRAGLEPKAVLGDYSGTPWSDTSERAVLIAGTGWSHARGVAP
ncbi:MAG: hypothetical protein QOJ81_350 [Chloroflexota bacterium]|nr:hypothetical protein [Chloroflexota bacterium]